MGICSQQITFAQATKLPVIINKIHPVVTRRRIFKSHLVNAWHFVRNSDFPHPFFGEKSEPGRWKSATSISSRILGFLPTKWRVINRRQLGMRGSLPSKQWQVKFFWGISWNFKRTVSRKATLPGYYMYYWVGFLAPPKKILLLKLLFSFCSPLNRLKLPCVLCSCWDVSSKNLTVLHGIGLATKTKCWSTMQPENHEFEQKSKEISPVLQCFPICHTLWGHKLSRKNMRTKP